MNVESASDICLTVFGLNSTEIQPSHNIHLSLHLNETCKLQHLQVSQYQY